MSWKDCAHDCNANWNKISKDFAVIVMMMIKRMVRDDLGNEFWLMIGGEVGWMINSNVMKNHERLCSLWTLGQMFWLRVQICLLGIITIIHGQLLENKQKRVGDICLHSIIDLLKEILHQMLITSNEYFWHFLRKIKTVTFNFLLRTDINKIDHHGMGVSFKVKKD